MPIGEEAFRCHGRSCPCPVPLPESAKLLLTKEAKNAGLRGQIATLTAQRDAARAALTVIHEYATYDIDHDKAPTDSMMWSIEAEARSALKGGK